jgi:hypothetical protein
MPPTAQWSPVGYTGQKALGLIRKHENVAKEISPTTWLKDTMLGFYGN